MSIRPSESDPGKRNRRTVWEGEMLCYQCGHRWESRRNTPPARCPACSGRDIDQLVRIEEGPGRLFWIIVLLIILFILVVALGSS